MDWDGILLRRKKLYDSKNINEIRLNQSTAILIINTGLLKRFCSEGSSNFSIKRQTPQKIKNTDSSLRIFSGKVLNPSKRTEFIIEKKINAALNGEIILLIFLLFRTDKKNIFHNMICIGVKKW